MTAQSATFSHRAPPPLTRVLAQRPRRVDPRLSSPRPCPHPSGLLSHLEAAHAAHLVHARTRYSPRQKKFASRALCLLSDGRDGHAVALIPSPFTFSSTQADPLPPTPPPLHSPRPLPSHPLVCIHMRRQAIGWRGGIHPHSCRHFTTHMTTQRAKDPTTPAPSDAVHCTNALLHTLTRTCSVLPLSIAQARTHQRGHNTRPSSGVGVGHECVNVATSTAGLSPCRQATNR
jgi:hypothetical protein